eukprot:GHVU01093599.1.p1 GENE.GHVU01093599.1~~GHVU01093599.1.p1  ORF type:complete len:152 (-),score=8.49 GHVU01093599.1:196-651(-)
MIFMSACSCVRGLEITAVLLCTYNHASLRVSVCARVCVGLRMPRMWYDPKKDAEEKPEEAHLASWVTKLKTSWEEFRASGKKTNDGAYRKHIDIPGYTLIHSSRVLRLVDTGKRVPISFHMAVALLRGNAPLDGLLFSRPLQHVDASSEMH